MVDLKEPEFVGLLREGVDSSVRGCAHLYGAGSGQTTERLVEPWSVFSANGNWYLSAFCRTADAERVFRVDRIRQAAATDETFDPPDTAPPPEVRYTPGEEDVRTTIRLGEAAQWVADYYPVEDLGDGQIRFSSSDPAVAARLLLRLGERRRTGGRARSGCSAGRIPPGHTGSIRQGLAHRDYRSNSP